MKIFGAHDQETIQQLTRVAERAERVALMADGHVGYVMPIGGVAAYRNKTSVVGVGFLFWCLAYCMYKCTCATMTCESYAYD